MSFPFATRAVPNARSVALTSHQVLESDRTRREAAGDEQARGPAPWFRQAPNERAVKFIPADRGLGRSGVANPPYLAQITFQLATIDEAINGRARDALILGQSVEKLAGGAGSQCLVLPGVSRLSR
jgi:hypothetical protein